MNAAAVTEVDDCVNEPCGSNGTCADRILGYFCNCSVGYTGTHCETGIQLHAWTHGGPKFRTVHSFQSNQVQNFHNNSV